MSNYLSNQRLILEYIGQLFEEENVPTVLREADTEKLPMDILTTLHRKMGRHMDEVLGEYYFLPLKANPMENYYFTTMLTLDEQVEAQYAQVVSQAIRMLNFYIECGAFVQSADGALLAYKLTTPVPGSFSLEEIKSLVNINVAHSLQITEQFVDSLLMLSDGSETLDEFMKLMP